MKLRTQVATMAAAATLAVGSMANIGWAADAKYVFLFVGDGMGLPQRAAAVEYLQAPLVVDSFPAQGLTTTRAADRFITGSAAAATALASGIKTNIGVVGMDSSLKPVATIAEKAKKKGMKVGIVSSVSIDHATPAAFYAHVPKRGNYYDIDLTLATSDFDYFGGGGLKDPANKRKNGTKFAGDALEIARQNGFTITTDRENFASLAPGAGKVLAINTWLQDSGATPYDMDTSASDISLAEFTAKGIELLDNPNGFFMMVEGGKIDWACHANDAAAAIKDTIAFDKAIAKAVDFYKEHPEETIIVVTGDHECGGMTLGFAGTKYATSFEILHNQKISFQKFKDEVVKKFREQKDQSFSAIQPEITKYFGLKFEGPQDDPMTLKPHEMIRLEEAFGRTVAGNSKKDKSASNYLLYGNYDPLSVTITHILNQKAGIGWTTYKHTGVPVSTAAIGVGAETFQGMYKNTDIGLKLMKIAGLETAVTIASLAE